MRIVSGTARGTRLQGPPKGLSVRPTSDKVREAIFDVLTAALPGGFAGRAIDLYAGTGALGIEALSRGVEHAVFIERDRTALRIVRENLRHAGFADRATVLPEDAGKAIPRLGASESAAFTLAFLDPPYGAMISTRTAGLLVSTGLLAPGGILVIEHGAREVTPELPGLEAFRQKRYGDTRVAFLRRTFATSKTRRDPASETAPEAESEA